MHLKSHPKLIRSELHLDLSQQQGALRRRSGPFNNHTNQSTRLPLVELSTNALRSSNYVIATRARGIENSAMFPEDDSAPLNVWSVIKPGHVREKIALFALEGGGDRNTKGTWEVSNRRRRRTTQIQSQCQSQSKTLQTQSKTQTALKSPPSDPPEDQVKLSVVEMVAFLEQRINCEPHAKLRSSAFITLSRSPLISPPAPCPAPPPPDRPIAVEGEEPVSVSVSDMVAKLESLCLRQRTQGERRTVGRVLLAATEPNHALLGRQPISNIQQLKVTPTSSLETRKTSIRFCKSDFKVPTKPTPTSSTEIREARKTSVTTQATPTSLERSNAIGRRKTESPSTSQTNEAKVVLICKSGKTPKAKSAQRHDATLTAETTAILTSQARCDVTAKVETETSTHCDVAAVAVNEKESTQTSPTPLKSEKTMETEATPTLLLQTTSSLHAKSSESLSYDEPMPGLLFLTPPSKSSLQSEKRKPLSPTPLSISGMESNPESFLVLSKSDFAVQSEKRKTEQNPGNSSNSDLFLVLTLDRTVQSQMRTHCSFPLSPASSSDSNPKILGSLDSDLLSVASGLSKSPASNSDSTQSPVQTLKPNTSSYSDTLNASSSIDLNLQTLKRTNSDLSPRSLDTALNLSVQSKKRKPCLDSSDVVSQTRRLGANPEPLPVLCSSDGDIQSGSVPHSLDFEFSVLSEKNKAFLLKNSHLLDSALENQFEKRNYFPVTDSDLSNSDLSVQSETRNSDPVLSRSSSDVGSVLLRSSSDVGSHSDRKRRRKAVRALSLCSAVAPGRYRAVSEDFLSMRRRVQQLLEPRSQVSYLSLLPHHLLVHVLLLLPTQALAALKCTCHYFRLIIDTYDVRPADSLWVCDPRYRDDPCKQCKRQYRGGDVSLCRWHHKPFCQALPYGPGYWMCCQDDRRDALGCIVGLHDNRWVPAFHSVDLQGAPEGHGAGGALRPGQRASPQSELICRAWT